MSENENKIIVINDIKSGKYSEDLNKILIKKPKKKDDIYFSNVNLVFQTTKIQMKANKNNQVILNLDKTCCNFLNDLDKILIQKIEENSSDFFEDKVTKEDIEEIYKFTVTSKSILTTNVSKKLIIQNKSQDLVELNDVKLDDNIICLINCSKMVFYRNYCYPFFEIIQIKIKSKPSKPISSKKEYLFRENENDTYNSDDEVFLKTLKLKFK